MIILDDNAPIIFLRNFYGVLVSFVHFPRFTYIKYVLIVCDDYSSDVPMVSSWRPTACSCNLMTSFQFPIVVKHTSCALSGQIRGLHSSGTPDIRNLAF
jgi:hypothetical protein